MNPRLSARIRSIAPSATLAVTEKARVMRESGIDVISFGAGEPDFDTPHHVRDSVRHALLSGDTKYPPTAGKLVLREAICEYLKRYSNVDYRPSQVCVTVGAKDALYMAFASLLDPGDEVLIPVPYWVSYPDQVRLCEAESVFVRTSRHDSLKPTAADIRAKITPKTRVLVLNSPSNPSGEVFTRDELADIADVIRSTDILVVSDEIYHRLIFNGSPATSFAALPGMAERTVTINGVSKTYAMTGWRLGFAAGPDWIISAIVKMNGQTVTGAPSFIQTATVEALRGSQNDVEKMRVAYERRARHMWERLRQMPGMTCPLPLGAFFCFPDVSGTFGHVGVKDADQFAAALLDQAHVALVSGGPFGCPNHVRLSYATSDAEIEEGLNRLARFVGG